MKKRIQSHPRHGEEGQSLVELAIMMVVLLTILSGVVDLGRVYFTYLALQHAAGEGATYGSMFPTRHYPQPCDDSRYCPTSAADPNNVLYRVKHENPSRLVEWSGITVMVELVDDITSAGSPITVIVEYEYEVMTPVVEVIAGPTITLRATAVNTIIGFD